MNDARGMAGGGRRTEDNVGLLVRRTRGFDVFPLGASSFDIGGRGEVGDVIDCGPGAVWVIGWGPVFAVLVRVLRWVRGASAVPAILSQRHS